MNADPGLVTARGPDTDAPLIAHIIYRLDVGGLENGVINLINRMPPERFRHAIICLTDYSEFRQRLRRDDIPVYALNKPAGNSALTHYRLWQLLRRLRPAIVHTRNLAALEAVIPAALAGIRIRIHGEHGRDVEDLDGSNRKYQWWRRLLKSFVDHYIAVSRDLQDYLLAQIDVDPQRVTQIYNGVDSDRFQPAQDIPYLADAGFTGSGHFVIGTVGRMKAVKDQVTLARAFILLMQRIPDAKARLRLVMVGDGPLRDQVRVLLERAGLAAYAWLPGNRDDVADIMRSFHLFVLPSLAEGISNTILEAMATGLPVVATAVGGNGELVQAGKTGTLVPAAQPDDMAKAIGTYIDAPELCRSHGTAARRAVESRFSMNAMTYAYMSVYDKLMAAKSGSLRASIKMTTK